MVMPIAFWREVSLTGKHRARRGWFKKMILQVEVEEERVMPMASHYPKPSTTFPAFGSVQLREFRTAWRDATAADFNLNHTTLSTSNQKEE